MMKYENGYINDEGTLVPSGDNELHELIEEVTGLDMFELRDLAVDALGANEYLIVDSMEIESAKLMNGVDYKVLIIQSQIITPNYSHSVPVVFVADCK